MAIKFDRSLLDGYFPFDEYREGQKECIEFVLKAFESGKRHVIVEAPTGSGKSGVGVAVSKYFNASYYLTIQKILQTQMINDFGSDGTIVDLKGRATYLCTYYKRHGARMVADKLMSQSKLSKTTNERVDCTNGYCRKKLKEFKCARCFKRTEENSFGKLSILPPGMTYSACPYYEQLGKAMAAQICLMNFSSFLFQTRISNRFGQRDLLVIDEAHQMEPQLLSFISIALTDKKLRDYGITLPEYQTPEEYWMFFVETNIMQVIADIIKDCIENEDITLQDEYTLLLRRLRTFLGCMEREEEWVAEYVPGKAFNTLKLKPVFASSKSHPYILDFGVRTLMMSATILDVDIFCQSLGIARSDTAAIRMKNRFPVANRPIIIRSAGDLAGGKKKMPQWGPRLLSKVDEVVDDHPSDRGIIHTHNFNIANLLVEQSRHRGRFMFQKNFKSKEDMLATHADTAGSIIVAPAMHEGLDLMDDLSRFQIICKIPWANFFDDKQLARRVELDTRYYVWMTALKLVQSYGRSVRSETDHAKTYVVDGGFRKFLDRARGMIPKWFLDAIQ